MYSPFFVGVLCLSLVCYETLCVHSSFAITLKRKRKLLLCYYCLTDALLLKCYVALPHVAVVGLQYVIVVFPNQ